MLAVILAVTVGCQRQSSPGRSSEPVSPTNSPRAQKSTKAAAAEGLLPTFTEVARESGIEFERYDDVRGLHRLMESTGGGVGLLDYDNDGLLDVVLTNGCRLPLSTNDRSHATQIYRNLGHWQFENVTSQTGLSIHGYCQGCAVGDYDNDGFDDLYVAAYGRNWLWKNNGDGTFRDVTEESGTDCVAWSTSAAFADVNLDGYLDLYVVNYVEAEDDPPKLCPAPESPDGYTQCPPTMFPASRDVLFLNQGDGRFQDATELAGITSPDGKGLGVVVFDANQDGRPDIYVANDGTPNFLYMNQPQVKEGDPATPAVPLFEDCALKMGVALNYQGAAEAGMGIACGDYDADGWSDLLVTNFFAETNTLYRNLGGAGFADVTNGSRLGPPSRPMLGFGTTFLDFDNDGWLDLFVANGHVDDVTWANTNEPYRMPPQFFRNEQDGTFSDVSGRSGDYFQQAWLGRGVAAGDLDNDGDLDFIVSHQLGASALLRNDTQECFPSVTVRLVGRGRSNRSAIGARVEASWSDTKLVREVVGGGGFQSSGDPRVHIGLGPHEEIETLTVTWPSGATDRWEHVAPGFYVAVEGQNLKPAVENKGR